MSIAPDFSGTWKCTKTEGLDDYLKAIGVGFMGRKMASTASPTLVIVQDGDYFEVTTKTLIKTMELKYTIGEEFPFDNPMVGKKFKCLSSWDGRKLVVKAWPIDDPSAHPQTTIRELDGDQIIQTMIAVQCGKDVICTRLFTKT